MTDVCQKCRYWSEMIARAGGGTTNPTGAVEALCLSASGPKAGKYTTSAMTCSSFKVGEVVDSPGLVR